LRKRDNKKAAAGSEGGAGTVTGIGRVSSALLHERPAMRRRQQRRLFIHQTVHAIHWRTIMESVKRVAGLSLKGELVAVVAAMLASVASFGIVVALYASASGELHSVIAKVRAAPAASSAVVVVPRKPKSG
jgi:hypothetical protein